MPQEPIPEHITPKTSIRLAKLHLRRGSRLLPKNGNLHGRNLPPETISFLRDNLAQKLWELRNYPDEVTLEEAYKLSSEIKTYSNERDTIIRQEGVRKERL